jgi:hypothetical protein
MAKAHYEIKSKLWLYPGDGGWHFVTISNADVVAIKDHYNPIKRGWGSIPVEVTIGSTTWETSLFPGKDGTYLLPIKATVRQKEKIISGDTVELYLRVLE